MLLGFRYSLIVVRVFLLLLVMASRLAISQALIAGVHLVAVITAVVVVITVVVADMVTVSIMFIYLYRVTGDDRLRFRTRGLFCMVATLTLRYPNSCLFC